MWIQIVPGTEGQPDLLLPYRLWKQLGRAQTDLRYGARTARISLGLLVRGSPGGTGAHRAAPARLVAAPRLLAQLTIRTEPVYRLREDGEVLEVGPVVGLLLGNRTHWYNNAYLMREPERVIPVYEEHGGLFCAFSPRNVSTERGCAYGLFYNPRKGRWRFGTLPLPRVLHRRSFHSQPEHVERLRQDTGAILFNSRRFDKWEVYELLCQDRRVLPHLPETRRVKTGLDICEIVERHGRVILKPAHLSRGRGILFASRKGKTYRVADCRIPGEQILLHLDRTALDDLVARELAGRRYLCQQCIDLARIGGDPFDIRVVAQRTYGGGWRCQAIECRLAGAGRLVTNLAFGGRALLMEEALAAAFGDRLEPAVAEGEVIALAERVCQVMDRTGEHFAEFGIDIALDQSGKPWFIESNVLPTFKGFLAIDKPAYRRILAAPMSYACFLTGFGAPEADQSWAESVT